jgi:hypothetical protein
MTLKTSALDGRLYDNVVERFIPAGADFSFDRLTHKLMRNTGIHDAGLDSEKGALPPEYDVYDYDGEGATVGPPPPPPPPTPSPITATANLPAKTITLGGGPADQAYTITITFAVDGGADQVVTQPVVAGQTAHNISITLATHFRGDIIGTVNAGGAIEFILDPLVTVLDKLTVTVT